MAGLLLGANCVGAALAQPSVRPSLTKGGSALLLHPRPTHVTPSRSAPCARPPLRNVGDGQAAGRSTAVLAHLSTHEFCREAKKAKENSDGVRTDTKSESHFASCGTGGS